MATPRIRMPANQRRQQIVEAVLRVIGEKGLTSLTTSALAREVGVTTGALFRHFDTLEEIHREVVRHALREIEATFPDESLEPLQRLLQLARNRVRLLRSNAGLAWVLRSEQAYLTMPKDAVRQLRGVVARSRRFLLDAIREGAARGEIRGDIEPESLLVLVMGAIHAMAGMSGVHRSRKGRKGPEIDRVVAALERVLIPPATAEHAPTETWKPKPENAQKKEWNIVYHNPDQDR